MQTETFVDYATADVALPADREPHRWSLATRIGFRFAFCYLGGYCLFNGNATVFSVIPVIGEPIQDVLARVFMLPGQYLAQHWFHVPPPGNVIHPTGSGDTAIGWIAAGLLLAVSIVATVVWSALDRRRENYQTLEAWLRFAIRLTLGLGMVVYGLSKVFPMQMPPPSMASLAEPMGMHSPMAILWSFIGVNPLYEMICGAAELLCGVLLLLRRTALMGALITIFVVTNVLLFNLFFDVPVKLYAGHLVLLSMFVVLPDARALWRFFWRHEPAAPTGVWVPRSSRRWFRRTTVGIEVAFAALAFGGVLIAFVPSWNTQHAARVAALSAPLRGAWRIDSATIQGANGTTIDHPVMSDDKHPFVELAIDSNVRAAFRDSAGRNWGFPTKTDMGKHTIEFTRPDDSKIMFAVTQPDKAHLVLTPMGAEAKTASTMKLTLVSPPGGYLLTTRGFHWVSEFAYQR